MPGKLFNKVVAVRGVPGFWFVLTYIPDLQWCHLGPLEKRGKFGCDKSGKEIPLITGSDRWMLCAEGSAQELDVSSFNCIVTKFRTIRKTADADKEEWAILDYNDKKYEVDHYASADADADLAEIAEALNPGSMVKSNDSGARTSAQVSSQADDGGRRYSTGAASRAQRRSPTKSVDDEATPSTGDCNMNSGGNTETARSMSPFAFPLDPSRMSDGSGTKATTEVEKQKGAAKITNFFKRSEASVPEIRFTIGDLVLGNYRCKGRSYPGRVEDCVEVAPGDVVYTVRYDDGDVERCVRSAMLRHDVTARGTYFNLPVCGRRSPSYLLLVASYPA